MFDPERIVFLNGEYVPAGQAQVSVFDRGYLMADAVYEFTAVLDGKLLDFPAHMKRLRRSLGEIGMACPLEESALLEMHKTLVSRNGIDVGGVYLQISRGVAERDFVFPEGASPTVMAFTQALNFLKHPANERGLSVVSVSDGRWARRDIKTTQLLYTSMVKTRAQADGADDVLFVQDGVVTEGSSANAFIVRGNRLITAALSQDLLHGITRASVLQLAEEAGLEVEERAFSIREAQAADEAFITASPLYALPIVRIDGQPVGTAAPGPYTKRLRQLFLAKARATAI